MKTQNAYRRKFVFRDGRLKVEARYILEQHLGRKLQSSEIVHHINENSLDNRIENLQIVSRSEHKKIHSTIGQKTRYKNKYRLDPNLIIQLYLKNTIVEIAESLKCSEVTIRRLLKKHLSASVDLRSLRKNNYKQNKEELCKNHL